MNKEKNDPWGQQQKTSRLYTILLIIPVLAAAIYFWQATIALVVLVLILFLLLLRYTVNRTSYREPKHVDSTTGNELVSFYMGGEWVEDDPPYYDDCINAWAFMLSEAEEISSEAGAEEKEPVIHRALHILEQARLCEEEPSYNTKSADTLSDLMALLQNNKKSSWLLDELLCRIESLEFDLDDVLEKSKSSNVVDALLGDWESKAQLLVDEVKSTIPKYTDKHVKNFVEIFGSRMLEAGNSLKVSFDVYDPVSLKINAGYDWGNHTVIQSGLSVFSDSWEICADDEVFNYKLFTLVEDAVYDFRNSQRFDFLFSKSTCIVDDKDVPVLAEVADIDGGYIWSVNEANLGPVDVFHEHEEIFIHGPSVRKVSFSIGDDELIFEVTDSTSQANQFFNQLGSFLSQNEING